MGVPILSNLIKKQTELLLNPWTSLPSRLDSIPPDCDHTKCFDGSCQVFVHSDEITTNTEEHKSSYEDDYDGDNLSVCVSHVCAQIALVCRRHSVAF